MSATLAAKFTDQSHNIERIVGAGWTPVAHLQIPRIGWEMDNDAWAVLDATGELRWLMTDHARMVETTREVLAGEIARMQRVLDLARRALAS